MSIQKQTVDAVALPGTGLTLFGVVAAIWAGLQFVHDKGKDYRPELAAVATNAGAAGFVVIGLLAIIRGPRRPHRRVDGVMSSSVSDQPQSATTTLVRNTCVVQHFRSPLVESGTCRLGRLSAQSALPGGPADVAQLVEHHLAKVRVAGSNPVVRSSSATLFPGR